MIEIVNVNKSYNGKVKAVDNLSLTVPEGEIIGFLGPNGAGKTTTIKMITGILNPDSGTIKINGIDIKEKPMEAKQQFGFVPDSELNDDYIIPKAFNKDVQQKVAAAVREAARKSGVARI